MIVTFYSYKGGVGRSQLLANVAAYFCHYKNKKVLLIDWDLEAPGLHFYFNQHSVRNKGLLDLLTDFCSCMEKESVINEDAIKNDLNENFDNYVVRNITSSKTGLGHIDLITAGYYGDDYSKKMNQFDWRVFYENLDGSNYIEILKRHIKNLDYDFIFLDSRTGISDYSGICNIQMPDANIVIIAPSEQNINGSKKVMDSIINSRYLSEKRRSPIVFPILSRLDPLNNEEQKKWIKKFRNEFKEYINNIINLSFLTSQRIKVDSVEPDIEQYISHTLLEYKTDMSYGETVLFKQETNKIEYTTLENQFKVIANLISAFQNYPLVELTSLPFDNVLYQIEKLNERMNSEEEIQKFSKALIYERNNERKQRILGQIESKNIPSVASDPNNTIIFEDGNTILNLKETLSYQELVSQLDQLDQKFLEVHEKIIQFPEREELKQEILLLQEEKDKVKEEVRGLKHSVITLAEEFSKSRVDLERVYRVKTLLEEMESDQLKFKNRDLWNELKESIDQVSTLNEAVIWKNEQLAEEFLIKARLAILDLNNPNRLALAKEYFEKSVEIKCSFENVFLYSVLLHEQNLFNEAKTYYALAEALALDAIQKAKALTNLSTVNKALDLYKEAEENLLKAQEILLRGNINNYQTLDLKASIIDNLANLYVSLKEDTVAEQLYTDALNIRRELVHYDAKEYLPDLATSLNNFAVYHFHVNNFNSALSHHEEALKIRRYLVEQNSELYLPDLATSLNNIAVLFNAERNFTSAERAYHESLEIFTKITEVNTYSFFAHIAMVATNLSNFYINSKNNRERSLYYARLTIEVGSLLPNQSSIMLDAINQTFKVINSWGLDVEIFSNEIQKSEIMKKLAQ